MKRSLFIVLVLIAMLAATVAILMSCANYVELHNATTNAEAGRLFTSLQEMGISVRVDGTRILVAKSDDSEELRSLVATLLSQQTVTNLEILNIAPNRGEISEEQARKLLERQREEELRTAILRSPKFQDALVVVCFGESALKDNSSSGREAAASVVLVLKDNETLSDQEVQNIADVIKRSVPGITYENITILTVT